MRFGTFTAPASQSAHVRGGRATSGQDAAASPPLRPSARRLKLTVNGKTCVRTANPRKIINKSGERNVSYTAPVPTSPPAGVGGQALTPASGFRCIFNLPMGYYYYTARAQWQLVEEEVARCAHTSYSVKTHGIDVSQVTRRIARARCRCVYAGRSVHVDVCARAHKYTCAKN